MYELCIVQLVRTDVLTPVGLFVTRKAAENQLFSLADPGSAYCHGGLITPGYLSSQVLGINAQNQT